MEVDVLLEQVQVEAAIGVHVIGVVLAHQLDRALDHPAHARGPDEHVVRLLLEHEVARARQRIERRLAQRCQLIFAVAVGEVGEHEEREPVGGLFVERAEDARVVGVAGVAFEHLVGFVAAITAEVALKQVHHRPQVAALFDVDLEQVAHVIQRRCREREVALLFHRCRLGVALDHEQASKF